ncbi:MAG: hypothetical protein ACPGSD_08580 [Flavobacteriales bacterium]
MSHLNQEFHTEFISLRMMNSEVSENDIPFILELLNDINKKWFIASYLQTISNINNVLLKKFIEVGIQTTDPSYNRFFIEPCLRVFGCIKVIELLENSLNDNLENSSGVLSAVYHVHSLIGSIGKLDSYGAMKWERVGFEYKWNSKVGKYESYSKDETRRMTIDELRKYESTHSEFINRKRNLILNIKERTNDSALIERANRMLEQI